MNADRDAAARQLRDGIGKPGAAFELDQMSTGTHEGGGIRQRIGHGCVSHEGQVGHQQ